MKGNSGKDVLCVDIMRELQCRQGPKYNVPIQHFSSVLVHETKSVVETRGQYAVSVSRETHARHWVWRNSETGAPSNSKILSTWQLNQAYKIV